MYGKIPPIWERMADSKGNVMSNYGWQMYRNDQLDYVIAKLRNEKEKPRLKSLINSIRPPGVGIIVRTVAEGKKSADLHSDLSDLMKRWVEMYNGLKRAKQGKRILGELNKTSTVLRDVIRP